MLGVSYSDLYSYSSLKISLKWFNESVMGKVGKNPDNFGTNSHPALLGVIRSRPESLGVFRSPRSRPELSVIGCSWSRPESAFETKICKRGAHAKHNEIKCLITSTLHQMASVNSDLLRFRSTLIDFGRLRMTLTPVDSGRLRTAPDESRWLRTTPDDSERLW